MGSRNRDRIHHCHLTLDNFFICSCQNKAYEQLTVLLLFVLAISLEQLLYPESSHPLRKLQNLDVRACGGFSFGDLVPDQVSKHHLCPLSLTYSLSLALSFLFAQFSLFHKKGQTHPKAQTGHNIAVELHSDSFLRISSASEFRGMPLSVQCVQEDHVWYTCHTNQHKNILVTVANSKLNKS